ncbi:hypothetical protein [Euzebya tangerina]|uniref:hypothetical protein n=1 Tax=Euzebya tangerina TaxID=591198 RepID=UPI000E31FF6C|nr:hypothetical protein [Euzebya tangerina]
MTPTLNGRIQSKLFLLLVVAPLWTVVITVLLVPLVRGADATMTASYGVVLWNAIQVLLWTALFGVGWEFLWHALQQSRWEKDWPILYGLLQFIPEGILIFFLVNPRWGGLTTGGGVPTAAFLLHYISTVLVTWTWINGPHRILFLKWRFEGGRFV